MGRNVQADAKRREERREEILAAAERAFCGGGGPCPVESVAGKIGLSKATVYLYFRDKTELLDAVTDRALGRFVGSLEEEARSEAPPEERLMSMIRSSLRFGVEQRFFLRMLLDAPPPVRARMREHWKRSRDLFREVLEDGLETGRFRPHDPDLLALCAFSMTRAQLFYEGKRPTEALAQEIGSLLLTSLLVRPRPRKGRT